MTVTHMSQRGDIPKADYEGLYDLRKVLRRMYERLKEKAPASSGSANERLVTARAELLETTLAQKRRELVPIDEVIRSMAPAIVVCRSGILGLPERLAMLVPGPERNTVQAQARDICDKLLSEFKDVFIRYESAESGGDDEPPPEGGDVVDASEPDAKPAVV